MKTKQLFHFVYSFFGNEEGIKKLETGGYSNDNKYI